MPEENQPTPGYPKADDGPSERWKDISLRLTVGLVALTLVWLSQKAGGWQSWMLGLPPLRLGAHALMDAPAVAYWGRPPTWWRQWEDVAVGVPIGAWLFVSGTPAASLVWLLLSAAASHAFFVRWFYPRVLAVELELLIPPSRTLASLLLSSGTTYTLARVWCGPR
jgi:hypothetical protein